MATQTLARWATKAARMMELWEEGKTDKEIAAEVGVTPSAIQSWRFRNQLAVNPGRRGSPRTWDTDAAIKLYEAGKTDREIAEALGIKINAVFKWRSQIGLPSKWVAKSAPNQQSSLDPEQIRALHAQGMTDHEIAEAAGCSYYAVRRFRLVNSLPINPAKRGPKSMLDEAAAMALYKQGKNDREIAKTLFVSVGVVQNWRKRMGLPSRYVAKPPKRPIGVDLEQIRALHGEGLPDKAIAEQLGCSQNWVQKLRSGMGLDPNRAHAINLERDRIMRHLYEQSLPDTRIADEVGCSVETVRKWRRRNDLAPVKRAPASAGRDAEMMALYNEGLNDGQIADRVYLNRTMVYAWLKKRGLPPNQSRGAEPAERRLPMPKPVTKDRFYMTDDEILTSWRRAANPRAQVAILAQLNACSERKMRAKLEALGVDPYDTKRGGSNP